MKLQIHVYTATTLNVQDAKQKLIETSKGVLGFLEQLGYEITAAPHQEDENPVRLPNRPLVYIDRLMGEWQNIIRTVTESGGVAFKGAEEYAFFEGQIYHTAQLETLLASISKMLGSK